ncbi:MULTISPECIES: hypothetical protein [unclassified Erwinia]|nr:MULTISPECIES: hypothetical protein [unclassified Erwinia]
MVSEITQILAADLSDGLAHPQGDIVAKCRHQAYGDRRREACAAWD